MPKAKDGTRSNFGDFVIDVAITESSFNHNPAPLPNPNCSKELCYRPRYLGDLCKFHSDIAWYQARGRFITPRVRTRANARERKFRVVASSR